jgi:hypothetical protein
VLLLRAGPNRSTAHTSPGDAMVALPLLIAVAALLPVGMLGLLLLTSRLEGRYVAQADQADQVPSWLEEAGGGNASRPPAVPPQAGGRTPGG